MNSSTVITESGGRQNMYATEVRMIEDPTYNGSAKEAELANARWAMIGFIAILLIEAISQSSFLKWVGLFQ